MHTSGWFHEKRRTRIFAVCWQKTSHRKAAQIENAIRNSILPTFRLSYPSLQNGIRAFCFKAFHCTVNINFCRSLRLLQLTEEQLKQPLRKLYHCSYRICEQNFWQGKQGKSKSRKPKMESPQLCLECLSELYPGKYIVIFPVWFLTVLCQLVNLYTFEKSVPQGNGENAKSCYNLFFIGRLSNRCKLRNLSLMVLGKPIRSCLRPRQRGLHTAHHGPHAPHFNGACHFLSWSYPFHILN